MREWRVLTAVAALGLVVLVGAGSTEARWAAVGTVEGTVLHTGEVDLQVDGRDTVAGFAPFSLTGLEPGGGEARTLAVTNAGTVPTTWSAALQATGTNGLDAALNTRVTDATSTDGSTCGGTPLSGSATLAPGASTVVCVEVGLSAGAPSSVAGSTARLTLAATGRTVRGAWPDTATASGAGIATAALTPPAIRCTRTGPGAVEIGWEPVPGATGYRVQSASLLGGATELVQSATGYTFTGLAGTVTVVAELGSQTWVSAPSNTLTFSALANLTGTCS